MFRGIAVHPKQGYLYYTDWAEKAACVGRSLLDGSNHSVIVTTLNDKNQEQVGWLNVWFCRWYSKILIIILAWSWVFGCMEYPEISFHALFAYAKMLTNMRNRPVFMRIYAIDTYLRCRIIPIFLIIFFYFSFLNEYVSRIYPPKFDFPFSRLNGRTASALTAWRSVFTGWMPR